MTAEAEVDQRMDVDAIEDQHGIEVFGESDIESAYESQPVLVGSVRHAEVRSDRKLRLALEVLACGCIDALAAWRADAIGACTDNHGRHLRTLAYREPIHQRVGAFLR